MRDQESTPEVLLHFILALGTHLYSVSFTTKTFNPISLPYSLVSTQTPKSAYFAAPYPQQTALLSSSKLLPPCLLHSLSGKGKTRVV